MVSTRRSRCIATVVDRSRTSDRLPGSRSVRVWVVPVAELHAETDCADRLLGASAAGARDSGDRDRGVRAEAVQRACRHRLGDRLRHRSVRLDERAVDAEQVHLRVVRVRHHAARDVADDPARSVNRAATMPAVQDSAVAIVRPASSSAT